MATFTNNFYGGGKGYNLCLDVVINSQNVANNTSNVTVTVRLVSLGSSYTISASSNRTGSLTIDGTTYSFNFTSALSGNQNKTLFTKTVTVTHDSTGAKTLSASATCDLAITLSGTYHGKKVVSGSVILTTIPRTTPVTISGSATFGSEKWIGHARASSDFTVTLRYVCGNASGTIVSKSATNESWWAPPKSLQSQIPKATSINITVYCDTYSGSTLLGTTSTTFTCNIADDCIPVIYSAEFKNPDTSGTSYWQTASKVCGAFNCGGAYGSEISKYVMTVDGQTLTAYSNTIWSGVLTGSGYKNITLTITDTRGKTGTYTWTNAIYITAYSKPVISRFTCKRTGYDESGNEVISNLGTIGYFTATGTFHSSATNKSRKFMYKPTGTSSWTTVNLSNSNQSDYKFSSNLATGSAYDLKYVMTDSISTVEMTIVMQNVYPLINLSADGTAIAFGKECNATDKFMVHMDASFNYKTDIWQLNVTGDLFTSKAPLKVDTSNGIGTYYGNQIWLSSCLAVSSTGSSGTLYFNSGANHAFLDFYGSSHFRGRGSALSILNVATNGDGNTSGDGLTHIGYYQSDLGGYGHYFRGLGRTYVETRYGLQTSSDIICGKSVYSDTIQYRNSGGFVTSAGNQSWGVGCYNHFVPTTTERYLGVSSARWQQLYCVASPNVSSDARAKENVKYMANEPENMSEFTDVKPNDEITTQDLLDFLKTDLYMVTYDYKQNTDDMEDDDEIEQITQMNNRQIGFIAQDIAETKVGKYLITKDADGTLGYESANWTSIIAGALQQEIRTREEQNLKLLEILEAIINM